MRFRIALFLLLGLSLMAASGPGPVRFEDYPQLSKEELGQLVWFHHLAEKEVCDFSEMEARDQAGMTAYRYQIAFTTYGLALTQYHKLPAWREAGQEMMGRFMDKMLCKQVWEFWATTSRNLPAIKLAEGHSPRKNPSQHDPVADQNIMYSGHVAHMVGLYEMLYRDFRYDAPGAITFRWDQNEAYAYDHHSLTQRLYDQMAQGKVPAICCEPGFIFSQCNQHPVLAYQLHDYLHGTRFFEISPRFFEFMLEKKMIDPKSHLTARMYWLEKDLTLGYANYPSTSLFGAGYSSLGLVGIPLKSPAADGWTGAFLHAWMPEYVARNYPFQKKAELILLPDGVINTEKDLDPMIPHGFFAAYAREMGDEEVARGLIAYADRHFHPEWKDGGLHYLRAPKEDVENITGVLIALARANVKDGLQTMHQKPFREEVFSQPTLTGIDFPRVLVSRAIYDPERKALLIALVPGANGPLAGAKAEIMNLAPDRTYRLILKNGPTLLVSPEGPVELSPPIQSARREGSRLVLILNLSEEFSFALIEV